MEVVLADGSRGPGLASVLGGEKVAVGPDREADTLIAEPDVEQGQLLLRRLVHRVQVSPPSAVRRMTASCPTAQPTCSSCMCTAVRRARVGTSACAQLAPLSVDTSTWPRSPTTTTREPTAAPSSSSDAIASGAFTASAPPAAAGASSPRRKMSALRPAFAKRREEGFRAGGPSARIVDSPRAVGLGVFTGLRGERIDTARRAARSRSAPASVEEAGDSAGRRRDHRRPWRRSAAGVKSRVSRSVSQVHIGNSLSRPNAR